MAVHAAFAEELAGLQNPDYRLLASFGLDGELDPAFLDVEYRIGDRSLLENILIFAVSADRFARSDLGEKRF
jgi:hypothetical protein